MNRMSGKKIDEKNLENISGAGENVNLQQAPDSDDNDLIINPVEPDPHARRRRDHDPQRGHGLRQDHQRDRRPA